MDAHELNILHETTALRTAMMETLTDADLAFKFPNNPTLGELCVYMGDVERSYIDSFKTGKQVWDKRNTDSGLSGSVEKLKAWYKALDDEFDAVLNTISDEDFLSKSIDRGWPVPFRTQFHIYREAVLIWCGKCDVYLRAMGKPLGEQWRGWIG